PFRSRHGENASSSRARQPQESDWAVGGRSRSDGRLLHRKRGKTPSRKDRQTENENQTVVQSSLHSRGGAARGLGARRRVLHVGRRRWPSLRITLAGRIRSHRSARPIDGGERSIALPTP